MGSQPPGYLLEECGHGAHPAPVGMKNTFKKTFWDGRVNTAAPKQYTE